MLAKQPENRIASMSEVVRRLEEIQANSQGSVDPAELLEYAGLRLPAHMVPSSIMVLAEIPLTPVGKLDRKALPAPVFEAKSFRAPTSPIATASISTGMVELEALWPSSSTRFMASLPAIKSVKPSSPRAERR